MAQKGASSGHWAINGKIAKRIFGRIELRNVTWISFWMTTLCSKRWHCDHNNTRTTILHLYIDIVKTVVFGIKLQKSYPPFAELYSLIVLCLESTVIIRTDKKVGKFTKRFSMSIHWRKSLLFQDTNWKVFNF